MDIGNNSFVSGNLTFRITSLQKRLINDTDAWSSVVNSIG